MSLRYLTGVSTLTLDKEKCSGCGICLEVCPHEVFQLHNGKVEIRDRDACMECGACRRNCAFQALSVRAGVGCATAIIAGSIKGTAPQCGGEETTSCGCS